MVRRSFSYTAAFSLLETIIVIAVIAILSILAFFLINPRKQLEKAWDSQRKSHFAHLQRVLEDYYNDKSSYPTGNIICYDQVQEVDGVCSCHLCGAAGDEGALGSYISRLYCDPEFARKNYLYQYDCSTSQPRWYRMCGSLSADVDAVSSAPLQNYNYGVSSTNITVDECRTIAYTTIIPTPSSSVPSVTPPNGGGVTITVTLTPSTPLLSNTPTLPSATPGGPTVTHTPTPTTGGLTVTPTPNYCPADPANKFCIKNNTCNNCGSYSNCGNGTSCDQPLQLYSNPSCSVICE